MMKLIKPSVPVFARLAGLAFMVVILYSLVQSEMRHRAKLDGLTSDGQKQALDPRKQRRAPPQEVEYADSMGSDHYYNLEGSSVQAEPSAPNLARFPDDNGYVERPLGPITEASYECPQDIAGINMAFAPQSRFDCKKRLPSVMSIGFEQCGTDALSVFLSEHPAIKQYAVPTSGASFWSKGNLDKGMAWYINQMPVSTAYQVAMEREASAYVYDLSIPERMSLVKPEMRFVLMVCDPVVRALSGYLHLRNLQNRHLQNDTDRSGPREAVTPTGSHLQPLIAETFERSVLDSRGFINANSSIVARGRYEVYLREWLEYFLLEQFLIIDGTAFRENPLPILLQVERFLGVFPYFDGVKVAGICRTHPSRGCFTSSEALLGVQHGALLKSSRVLTPREKEVVTKMRTFYQPYNARLEYLTGKKLPWS